MASAQTEYMRKWRNKNRERMREINRRYRGGPKGQQWLKTTADRRNANRRARYRNGYLARQYGITLEEFEQLLVKQGGRCGICKTSDPGRHGRKTDKENWHIDHDHETGKVRGLLCFACNVGIGHLKDDPLLVKAALDYLLQT